MAKRKKKSLVDLLKCNSYIFQNRILRELFSQASFGDDSVVDQIHNNTFLKDKFMNAMYRGGLNRFDKINYFYNSELSDKDSIRIACSVLCFFREKVKTYIELRAKYEYYYLNGKYIEALETLDKIDFEVCTSLWACGQRFVIKELCIGLEGNKRELSAISEQIHSNFLAQKLLYFYSCMAEKDMSYDNYQTEISRHFEGLEMYDAVKYLANKLDFKKISYYEEIALVVQIDCQCSLIDCYNSVEKYFPVCYEEEIINGEIDSELLFLHGGHSSLFNNIATIMECHCPTAMLLDYNDSNVYKIIELYTTGEYSKACRLAKEHLLDNPGDFQVAIIYCKSLINGDIVQSPEMDIGISYVRNLFSVYSMDSRYKEAVLSLKHDAKLNHGLVLGNKIIAFLIRKRLIEGNEKAVFASSVLDSVLHPNFARYLSEQMLDNFERILHSKCPAAVSLAVAQRNGRFELDDLIGVTENKRKLALAKYLCGCGEFTKATEVITPIMLKSDTPNAYISERIDRVLLSILAGKGQHDLALKLLVQTYFKNEFLFERLESCGAYTVPRRLRDSTVHKDLYYIIYLFLTDRGNLTKQIVAYNNYLDSNDYSDILAASSELKNGYNEEQLFFYENVCTVGLLKRDVTLKAHSISAEEARRIILTNLVEINNSKKYFAEINSILTAESIKENLNTINKSRINVDTDKIFIMHKKRWEETYKKYLALTGFGPLYVGVDISNRNVDELNSQSSVSIRTPQDAVVFCSIVKQIQDECLFSSQYGMETYLSSRIRHGYCKGQLTSFLADLNLLSVRSNENSLEYYLNDYWKTQLDSESSIYKIINEILSEFSVNIEGKIDELLRSWLRIKRSQHSEGMFDYLSFVPLCYKVYGKEHMQEFALFYNRIIDAFWEYTEIILKQVRSKIDIELTEFYMNCISSMEVKLQRIPETSSVVRELLANCNLAKAKIAYVMHQFSDAFTANSAQYNDFTMEELTSSCRKVVERVHSKSSKAKWNVCADNTLKFRGKLFVPFVDILCILLNNAIEHSGIERIDQLEIDIDISEVNQNDLDYLRSYQQFLNTQRAFAIKVTNTLSSSISREMLDKKLEQLFAEIQMGTDSSALIQSEGGTGIYKLYNTAKFNVESAHLIAYDISDDSVTFIYCFEVDNLLCKEEDDDSIVD